MLNGLRVTLSIETMLNSCMKERHLFSSGDYRFHSEQFKGNFEKKTHKQKKKNLSLHSVHILYSICSERNQVVSEGIHFLHRFENNVVQFHAHHNLPQGDCQQ